MGMLHAVSVVFNLDSRLPTPINERHTVSVLFPSVVQRKTVIDVRIFVLGAGALSSPLVATQFAQLPHWSFHYLCSLGVAFINTVLLIAVFGLKTQDGMISTHIINEKMVKLLTECLAQIGQPAGEKGTNESSQFNQIFRLREVHLLAFFILVYVGVEVTAGGEYST